MKPLHSATIEILGEISSVVGIFKGV